SFSTKKVQILENGGGFTKLLMMMGRAGLKQFRFHLACLALLKTNPFSWQMAHCSIQAASKPMACGACMWKLPLRTSKIGKKQKSITDHFMQFNLPFYLIQTENSRCSRGLRKE